MAKLIKVCIAFAIGLLILTVTTTPAFGATIVHKRQAEIPESQKKDCLNGTPCGWAVYTPFKRTVDYFMKNTCKCPVNRTCIRTDDDLSTSAYVYRCREPKTSNTNSS